MSAPMPPEVIAAVDAHFQERLRQVPVLAQRAEAEGVTHVRAAEDVVPLLFPHTTYKSYPESLVTKGRWDQMNRWLDSLSAHRVVDVDVSGVDGVDGWIDRLHAAGHLVSSSSGTSGKGSFLNKSRRDREASLQNLIDSFIAVGLKPEPVWHVVSTAPPTTIAHNNALLQTVTDAFGRPDAMSIEPGEAPAGHHSYMTRLATMRRAMADGSARPDEIAEFEAEAAQRQEGSERRLQAIARQILEHRDERIMFAATFPTIYRLTEVMRELGAEPGDVTGENAMTTGGGLKGMTLPPDYQHQVFSMFNIDPSRFLHYYSMQELNLRLPKCLEGHYHLPPGLALFVLDKDGESLVDPSDGQVEGRAAFCDTSVDGRWGGTISGDKILVDLEGCPCGRPGPSVFPEISRFSDLPDGDKITCAGTMDAYVRGVIED